MVTKKGKKVAKAKKATPKVKVAPKAKKTVKKVVKAKAPAKKMTKKVVAKKAVKAKPVAKKTAPKKVAAKKTATKKTAAKKPAAKKPAAKKVVAKKTVAKKVVKKKVAKPKVKKATAKKSAEKKTAVKKNSAKKKNEVEKKTIEKPIIKKIEKKPAIKTTTAPKRSIESQANLSISLMGIAPYQEQSAESYMNEQQKVHFKKILERWKQVLMEEVDHTVSHMRDEVPYILADPNDRASREEVFNLELRTRDREGKLLKKIEEALERLDHEDEYGYCEMCGVEIGIRRLEARPTATLCIDCKTLDEIKERQRGG